MPVAAVPGGSPGGRPPSSSPSRPFTPQALRSVANPSWPCDPRQPEIRWGDWTPGPVFKRIFGVNPMPYLRGVVFDMDGVLCDSEPFLYRAARKMFLSRYDLEVSRQDFASFVGTGEDRYLNGVAETYGVRLQMPEDKELTYEIYLDMIEGELEPLPGVLDFVKDCREAGLKTAVATSADRLKMNGNLRQIGLPPEGFDAVVTGSEVDRKKPDPEIFLTAIRALRLSPEDCLVIEDSPSGVEAAVRAGARCLGVLSTFSREQLLEKQAAWIVEDLTTVPPDLRELLFVKRNGGGA